MTTSKPVGSRAAVLARIRAALADVTEEVDDRPPRDRRAADVPETQKDRAALIDLLAENLADYGAVVHRTTEDGLPGLVADLLAARDVRSLAVPVDLPTARWLSAVDGVDVLDDGPELTAARLDTVGSTLTGCALAVAETGTIVLDAGAAQGRRILTLVPDHHICVIREEQVVTSVPLALSRLDPARPQTWISGPSATSDIELDRVEGVHGPRTLEVILLDER